MSETSDLITHPFTAVRQRRGWSRPYVASIISLFAPGNRSTQAQKVYRWERDGVTPELAAQYVLADRLGVPHPVVLANPWPAWLLTLDQEEFINGEWSAADARVVLNSVVQSAVMDRRAFLSTTSTAMLQMATSWSTALPGLLPGDGRGALTLEAVNHLQRRVQELWHLDDALGGGGCLDAGVADLRLVSGLIRTRHYDPEVGQQLLGLAGALARFCGWAAFDAGRYAAAERFWHAGLRSAAAAGDTDQGVYTLSNLALAAVYANDGRSAIRLLDLARARVDPAQRVVRAMLDCWQARAHAIVGEPAAAAAAINRADDHWEQRRDGDDPAWVYWMPQPSETTEAATALLDSGDLAAAERNLHAGIDGAADAGPRDRTLYHARLAETQVRGGRLDEAAITTHKAIEFAVGVDSHRVCGRVNHVIGLIPGNERLHRELVEHRAAAWAA